MYWVSAVTPPHLVTVSPESTLRLLGMHVCWRSLHVWSSFFHFITLFKILNMLEISETQLQFGNFILFPFEGREAYFLWDFYGAVISKHSHRKHMKSVL